MSPQLTQWTRLHQQLGAKPRCFPTEPGLLQRSLLWNGCVLLAHHTPRTPGTRSLIASESNAPNRGWWPSPHSLAHISILPQEASSSLSSGTPFSYLQGLPEVCSDPFQPTPINPLPRCLWAVSDTAQWQLHHPSPLHAPCPRPWIDTRVVPLILTAQ